MGAEGNHGTDLAILPFGFGEEDGQIAVPGKVAAAADAVHQVGPVDVGRVHVAVQVHFDGGIHPDDAQAPYHFRVVGNFLRTQDQVGFVFVQVAVEPFLDFGGHGQGGTGSHPQLTGIDQIEHPVLDYFGIDRQVFEIRMDQTVDHSIGYRAHPGLQR